MKKLLSAVAVIFVLIACNKNEHQNIDCDDLMIDKFKSSLTCPYDSNLSTILAKGIYKGELIYFTTVICIACNTAPPTEGYNCKGAKVKIENFIDVSNIERIDACQ